MTHGFGIIGCGMISGFHAKAIADTPNSKLVACFGSPASADKLAAATGCRAYYDLREMLANPEVTIVTICTPSGAHMEPAVMAAEAGKHVIVEKPLEITLDRCDAVIRACEKAGVTLSTIFPSRFHEPCREMKRAIDEKRFGRLTMVDGYVKWYRDQKYYDSGKWRGTWDLDGGGALMNQAIHTADLLTWLAGPVTQITAVCDTLAHERIAVEDVAAATLRFANGAIGVLEATTAAYPGYLKRVQLHGSAGSAIMEEEDLIAWDFAQPSAADLAIREKMAARQTHSGGGASDPKAIGHHGHARQFADVVEAIEQKRPPAVDGYEGRRSVEIILAIYLASETGTTVTLPLASDPVLKIRQRKVEK